MSGNGSNRFGPEVEAAIREAMAGNERPSAVLRKLRAGTIDGLGPVPMPERTFYRRWSTAKRQQHRGRYTGPTFLDYMSIAITRDRTGLEDPDELAAETGCTPEAVRDCLAMKAKADEGGPRVSDQIAERRAAADA